jgi:hypothetical protein
MRVLPLHALLVGVVVLLGGAQTLCVRVFAPYRHSGCVRRPKMMIKSVEQALVAYQTDHSDLCPRQLDDLYAQGYLTKAPRDPWGEPLVFRCPGEHNQDGADIVSKGKDKQLGTADDIRSWEL